MCDSNFGCWGNGQCNQMLNDEEHCFDGGDCNYKYGKPSKCNDAGPAESTVIYMLSNIFQLTVSSRDLSRVEKKITVVASGANSQNSLKMGLCEKSCHFVSCSVCKNIVKTFSA